MARFIVHVIFLVVLAVLIVLNISYRTGVNVFGYEIENASVVVVMLLSFVSGALYALYAFFTYSISRRRRVKQKGRTLLNTQREQMLSERENDPTLMDRTRKARKKGSRVSDEGEDVPDTP